MTNDDRSHEPGKLEFKPDVKKLARLARFRRVALLITLALSGGALLLVITLQPRWDISDTVSYQHRLADREVSEEVKVAGGNGGRTPVTGEGIPASVDDGLANALRSAGVIYAQGETIVAQWRLVEGVVLYAAVQVNNVDEVLRRIGIARMVADSARTRMGEIELELKRLKEIMSGAVKAKIQISSVYRTANDFFAVLKEETDDRWAWLDAYEKAVRALAQGDEAEFDIKNNVAGGYLRKCEARRRRLYRMQTALEETFQRFTTGR